MLRHEDHTAFAAAERRVAVRQIKLSLRLRATVTCKTAPGQQRRDIALEIHSASAVAGPVPMAAATLEGLIGKAVAADSRPGLVH